MQDSIYMDAQDRLPVYALQSQLQTLILKKSRTLSDFGLKTENQQTWFVFLVMLYLMRQTLEVNDGDGVSLEEAAWQIQDIAKTQFGLSLNREQCAQLSQTIIVDILCNSGAPIQYRTGTRDEKSVLLMFLNSPTVERGGRQTGVYRMADDGFRLIIGTREMEENMKVSISHIIISMHMQAKNYGGALQETKEQIDRLRIEENHIRENINQIRSDVLSFSKEEADSMFEKNLKMFDLSRSKFQEIRQSVSHSIADARKQMEEGDLDAQTAQSLQLMGEIDDHLQYSITLMSRIIDALSDFLKTRRTEFLSQMGTRSVRTCSVLKDLYEPMIRNPASLEILNEFLHPLFVRDIRPIPEPHLFLEVRQYQEKPEETSLDFDEEEDLMEVMEIQRRQRLEEVAAMHAVFAEFMMMLSISGTHTMRLSQFRESSRTLGQMTSPRLLKEMLASWSMVKKVDLAELFQQEPELDLAVETLYSVPLSYLNAARENESLRYFRYLVMEKAEGKIRFPLEEDGRKYWLNMDDILLRLERSVL